MDYVHSNDYVVDTDYVNTNEDNTSPAYHLRVNRGEVFLNTLFNSSGLFERFHQINCVKINKRKIMLN